MLRPEDGFSLLEIVIATALMLLVTAGVFSMMDPAHGSFATEPEKADLQQRLRVGADTLSKDLIMAGAGAYLGTGVGSLSAFFAPVAVRRTSRRLGLRWAYTWIIGKLPPINKKIGPRRGFPAPAGHRRCRPNRGARPPASRQWRPHPSRRTYSPWG